MTISLVIKIRGNPGVAVAERILRETGLDGTQAYPVPSASLFHTNIYWQLVAHGALKSSSGQYIFIYKIQLFFHSSGFRRVM